MSGGMNRADGQLDSVAEASNYQSASRKVQTGTTSSSATTITLNNPHAIYNETSDDYTIAVKLAGESTYTSVYLLAGTGRVLEIASIGGTGDGSDNSKSWTVYGV